jgi:hypothetical protein
MPLFGRARKPTAFWHEPPIRTTDLDLLHHYAAGCFAREDGVGLMKTGWALYKAAGLHAHDAGSILWNGYQYWLKSPDFQPSLAVAFLTELFDKLNAKDRPVPADLGSVPPELIEPIAAHYSTRCWAGIQLLEAADRADRPEVRARYEPVVYAAIVRTPDPFIPPASRSWAAAYARDHDQRS